MHTEILDRKHIARIVKRKKIGNYWLGDFSPDGSFIVRYIGRSDTCLQRRLMEHASNGYYEAFIVRNADTIREAFDIESREWHLFGPSLDNMIHPDAPRHLPYKCPYPICNLNFSKNDECDSVGGEV